MSFFNDIKFNINSFKGDILNTLKSSFRPEQILRNALNQSLADLSVPRGDLNNIRPGDVVIESIALVSDDGHKVADLTTHVTEFNVYESILSPIMYATFALRDATGQEEHFRFSGHEMIVVRMNTPQCDVVEYKMHVMGEPYDKKISDNNKQTTYKINCCSLEAYLNAGPGFIQFMEYKDNVKNVVEKILKDNLNTSKNLHIDSTKGIEEGKFLLQHPFEAISHLKHTARSPRYPSHLFVFFENKNGYYFTTVERLIESGRKEQDANHTDKVFFFDTARNEDVAQAKMRNIIAYNKISGNDAGAKLVYGTGVRTAGIDTVLGNYTQSLMKTGAESSFQRSDSTGVNKNYPDMAGMYGARNPVRKLAVLNDVYDNHEERLSKMNSAQTYAISLVENVSQIEVYGDTELTVGDVISIDLPTATSMASFDGRINEKDSGNYLVAALRHIVLNSDRPQHVTCMELLKVGVKEK